GHGGRGDRGAGGRRVPAHEAADAPVARGVLHGRPHQPLGAAAARAHHRIPLHMVGGLRRLLPRNYLFTILGIGVGVAGLVALGAMAERITAFIDGGDRFVLGQISVAGEGMGMGTGFTAGGLLREEKIEQIARVPGVAAVQAQVMLPLNPTTSQFLTLTQELILGIDPTAPMPNRQLREMPVERGRFLRAGDRGVAVLGADFASSRHLTVGQTIELGAGRRFEVVGVLDKTLTAPDRFAIVPLEDARDLWLRRDPLLVQVFAGGRGSMSRRDLNTGAAVAWADGVDGDELARRIQATVPGVNVTIPGELSRVLRQSTAFFS